MDVRNRCESLAGAEKGSRRAPEVEARLYFFRSQPDDANHLIAAGLAGSNSNGGARHLQKFCEEFDTGLVGFTIDRGRGERDFEYVAERADHRILSGARLHFDREGYTHW